MIIPGFILLTIPPDQSFAYSCANNTEPKQLYKENDAVFIGKVVEHWYEDVGSIYKKSRVTFEVSSTLKGDELHNITVVTSAGTVLTEGTEFVVYAYETSKNNYLYKYVPDEFATDSICGGTKLLSEASYDLKQINELQKNKKIASMLLICAIILMATAIIIYIRKRSKS
ncbi:hypothetical protein [Paenibacillus endoradicis]|uniref:hypothetical protein n=1 Tax=Paenibacillus endoradicis TaxID=2972487 RepID=UPI0021593944|nr:hypothetical protein [Paenibacillus endoradicis]MCR8656853.1 hypothetical protein [Paenibacillus endoradicis]